MKKEDMELYALSKENRIIQRKLANAKRTGSTELEAELIAELNKNSARIAELSAGSSVAHKLPAAVDPNSKSLTEVSQPGKTFPATRYTIVHTDTPKKGK